MLEASGVVEGTELVTIRECPGTGRSLLPWCPCPPTRAMMLSGFFRQGSRLCYAWAVESGVQGLEPICGVRLWAQKAQPASDAGQGRRQAAGILGKRHCHVKSRFGMSPLRYSAAAGTLRGHAVRRD